jgi:hypothetical protein
MTLIRCIYLFYFYFLQALIFRQLSPVELVRHGMVRVGRRWRRVLELDVYPRVRELDLDHQSWMMEKEDEAKKVSLVKVS